MRALDRRRFLQLAGAGLASAPLAGANASPPDSQKKLITIFLRGGNDALNTLIPTHDPEYYAPGVRPSLAVPKSAALDLGVGGAALHPALAKLMPLWSAGELALAQRIGYPEPTLSHFAGQQCCETAKPHDLECLEGWVPRWAEVAEPDLLMPAVSSSPQQPRSMRGGRILPHVPKLSEYFVGSDAASQKLAGPYSALVELFGSAPGAGVYSALVHQTGDVLAKTLELFESLPSWSPAPSSFPSDDLTLLAQGLPVTYWSKAFFQELCDVVRILKFTHCRIGAVEIPGFDHHANQGLFAGDHPDRLAVLAHALAAIRTETAGDLWSDLAVLVQTEFGRTSAENGSAGTDHGRAGAWIAAGGSIHGGVWHCDAISWPAGKTLFSEEQRYVRHLTDYRAVLAELLERHLLLSSNALDHVIPGWNSLSGHEFAPLGLFD